MAIASSLYSSISGINTMGNAMSVLGDNVANVNTLSFKASRTIFQDVLSQSVSTASGSKQVGRGVTLSTVDGLFAQGSFQSSSISTDMAIGGQGFFMLRSADTTLALTALLSRPGGACRETVDLAASFAEAAGYHGDRVEIALAEQGAPAGRVVVVCDRHALVHALDHLMSHALATTPGDGPARALTVSAQAAEGAALVRLEAPASRCPAAGLPLAFLIARTLFALQGAELTVTPRTGGGWIAAVALPLADAQPVG